MTRRMEIVVRPDGQTTLTTSGFSGHSCRDASRFLEQALGQSTAEQTTAEYYQTAEQAQQQEHRS